MSKKREKSVVESPHKANKASLLLGFMGYSVIEIPRDFLEDFLNLCLKYGFYYFDLQIDEDSKIVRIKIESFQVKNILVACRMWHIKVKLISSHGLPQKLLKYRGRWGIVVGVLLSIALWILSQNVIWRIDIIGNDMLTCEQVIETLANQGFRVGGWIKEFDLYSVEAGVMINDDRISWIDINIAGTVATVEIRETLNTEIKEKNTTPANLISKFDAQIVGMEVYSGFPSVKEGDFVRKGDLLVSGIYKEGRAPLRFSRSGGRILGRISHTFEVEIPLVQEVRVYSDEKIEKKTLIFFGKSINFFSNYRNLPTSYDIINYIYTFNPFSLGELPISVSVDTYLPYELQEVEISEDEAIKQAYKKLRELIDSEIPDAQILRKKLSGEFVDDKYILKCTVVAICDIAKRVEFEILK